MKIFVAGATGAIGRRLVPMLVERGHEVTGATRTPEKVEFLRELGAHGVVVDALDAEGVRSAVALAEPEVVVHQLTAIRATMSLRDIDATFADTNRLRTRGTDNLLAASRAAGVRRFVAQSFTGWTNARTGGPVKSEDDPMDPHPAARSRQTMAAIRHVEEATRAAAPIEGIALRYAYFYGPGTGLEVGGPLLEMVRRRRLPIVGGGSGVWSWIHVDDAARATVLAVEAGATGVYNVADDEPAAVREWLPYLARTIGAPRPWRVPAWLVRPLIGEPGIIMMTSTRGADNRRARAELGWAPTYASWRQGFRKGLG